MLLLKGNMAPEYFMHGIVDEKTDVFSYGVPLLELVTGHWPVDSDKQNLVEYLLYLDVMSCYVCKASRTMMNVENVLVQFSHAPRSKVAHSYVHIGNARW